MKPKLEDYPINIRIKLSALWTTILFCYIYGDYFELYVPQKVETLLNGQNNLDNPSKLFMATIVLTIPSLMIFLSLVLTPKTTQWLNIGVALLLTLFTLLVGMSSLSEWRIFYVFLSILESVLTMVVVIMAMKWPRTSANTTVAGNQ